MTPAPGDRRAVPRRPGGGDRPPAKPAGVAGEAPAAAAAAPPVLRLATSNPHKGAELRRLLAAALGPLAARLRVRDLTDLPDYLPPSEDGADYAANALLKARAAAARVPGEAVLADDSGIEVLALDGAPGVRSNRWATGAGGAPLDGAGLNRALLERLGAVPDALRRARMVSCVALLLPDTDAPVVGYGEVHGRVAHEARGSGGFGYDAVFLLPDGRRLSEEPAGLKDLVGHRGKAVRAVVPALAAWLRTRPGSGGD